MACRVRAVNGNNNGNGNIGSGNGNGNGALGCTPLLPATAFALSHNALVSTRV